MRAVGSWQGGTSSDALLDLDCLLPQSPDTLGHAEDKAHPVDPKGVSPRPTSAEGSPSLASVQGLNPTYTGQHLCAVASGFQSSGLMVQEEEGDETLGCLLHPSVSGQPRNTSFPTVLEAAPTTKGRKKCCRLWPFPKPMLLKPWFQDISSSPGLWGCKRHPFSRNRAPESQGEEFKTETALQ